MGRSQWDYGVCAWSVLRPLHADWSPGFPLSLTRLRGRILLQLGPWWWQWSDAMPQEGKPTACTAMVQHMQAS